MQKQGQKYPNNDNGHNFITLIYRYILSFIFLQLYGCVPVLGTLKSP